MTHWEKGRSVGFKHFQSKVLLFGEYGVIYSSQALTVAYPLFSGQLTLPSSSAERCKTVESHKELLAFLSYLLECEQNTLDLTSLKFDIKRGLYFHSTIPNGFGLGSSGALCAAIYDHYKMEKGPFSLRQLREVFIMMESHFHGLSSGMDPLISYLGTPLLFHSSGHIDKVEMNWSSEGKGALFLLNTGRARRTEPLVNLFLEKCKSVVFERFFKEKITPTTERCIDHFLKGSYEGLWENFIELSAHQFEHFLPMIPKLVRSLWKRGLVEKHFVLKLCGAGGGGFLLGMTKDFQNVKKELHEYEVRPVCFF